MKNNKWLINKVFLNRIFIIVFSLLFSTSIISQEITITPIASSPCDHEFSLLINTSNAPFSPNISEISYFWYFGDGTWSIVNDQITNLPIDTHTYASSAFNPIYVEVTLLSGSGNYDDDDLPDRYYFSGDGNRIFSSASTYTTSSTGCPTPFPIIWNKPEPEVSIMTNRSLVNEDIVTYIIKYCNPCAELLDGDLTFTYDPSQLENETHFGTSAIVESIPVSQHGITNQSEHTDTLNISNLPHNECKYFLVRLKVKDINSVQSGDTIKVSAKLSSTSCSPSLDLDADHDQLVVASHDPNSMSSNQNFSCDGSNPQFTYVIKFQNDGQAPENKITVRNFIPDYFDKSTLQVTYPKDTNGDPPITHTDADTGEKCWKLNGGYIKNGKIKGTDQQGYLTTFYEEETIDYLIYTISLKDTASFRNCDAILNQAEIIFDDQPSMFTTVASTYIGCYTDSLQCDSCGTTKEEYIHLAPTQISTGSSTTLDFDVNLLPVPDKNEYTYKWYPSYGLTNTTNESTNASPIKGMHYYLVATNGCSRVIFHFPVEITNPPGPIVPPWVLVLTGLIILFIVWKYIIKKN